MTPVSVAATTPLHHITAPLPRVCSRGSTRPGEEGGDGLRIGVRERLRVDPAKVGAFLVAEVLCALMRGKKSDHDFGQCRARDRVEAGVCSSQKGV